MIFLLRHGLLTLIHDDGLLCLEGEEPGLHVGRLWNSTKVAVLLCLARETNITVLSGWDEVAAQMPGQTAASCHSRFSKLTKAKRNKLRGAAPTRGQNKQFWIKDNEATLVNGLMGLDDSVTGDRRFKMIAKEQFASTRSWLLLQSHFNDMLEEQRAPILKAKLQHCWTTVDHATSARIVEEHRHFLPGAAGWKLVTEAFSLATRRSVLSKSLQTTWNKWVAAPGLSAPKIELGNPAEREAAKAKRKLKLEEQLAKRIKRQKARDEKKARKAERAEVREEKTPREGVSRTSQAKSGLSDRQWSEARDANLWRWCGTRRSRTSGRGGGPRTWTAGTRGSWKFEHAVYSAERWKPGGSHWIVGVGLTGMERAGRRASEGELLPSGGKATKLTCSVRGP